MVLKELYKVGYMPYGNRKRAFPILYLLAPAPCRLEVAGAMLNHGRNSAGVLLRTVPPVDYRIKEN